MIPGVKSNVLSKIQHEIRLQVEIHIKPTLFVVMRSVVFYYTNFMKNTRFNTRRIRVSARTEDAHTTHSKVTVTLQNVITVAFKCGIVRPLT